MDKFFIFKPSKKQKLLARERRKNAPIKGSDEDYYQNLVSEHKNFEDVRRRASFWVLKQPWVEPENIKPLLGACKNVNRTM